MVSLFKHVFDSKIRRTKHFQEWFKLPMNYVRIKEFDFVERNLEFEKGDTVLDISSPKWLSFKLLSNCSIKLIVSDMDSYFVSDFETYINKIHATHTTQVFDARAMPLPDNSINKLFSVSVLEHIPKKGDIESFHEMIRVLKVGGTGVITLPANVEYVEEWLSDKTFYWGSISQNDGKEFYQRRYDRKEILQRFQHEKVKIDKIEFIAERPIEQPYINKNGMLMHNAYFIENKWIYRTIMKMDFVYFPLTKYCLHKYYSWKYHYLTQKSTDPNIRQVCIKFTKIR